MNKTAVLTAALAGLMMAGCASGSKATTDTAIAAGECHGANSCKGQGECGGMMTMFTQGHTCAGKNSCKGKGWIKLSKTECDTKGGTFKNM